MRTLPRCPLPLSSLARRSATSRPSTTAFVSRARHLVPPRHNTHLPPTQRAPASWPTRWSATSRPSTTNCPWKATPGKQQQRRWADGRAPASWPTRYSATSRPSASCAPPLNVTTRRSMWPSSRKRRACGAGATEWRPGGLGKRAASTRAALPSARLLHAAAWRSAGPVQRQRARAIRACPTAHSPSAIPTSCQPPSAPRPAAAVTRPTAPSDKLPPEGTSPAPS